MRTVSYCDYSYGDYKETRKGTMGEVHTIVGDITSCKSQRQKTVAQFSTKAEYSILLESAKEHNFTHMILQEIADVETLGYIYGNNEASIFLDKTNNYQIKQITLTPKSTLLENVLMREGLNWKG